MYLTLSHSDNIPEASFCSSFLDDYNIILYLPLIHHSDNPSFQLSEWCRCADLGIEGGFGDGTSIH